MCFLLFNHTVIFLRWNYFFNKKTLLFIQNIKFLIPKYLSFKHHSENECEFAEVKCPFNGCNERCQRRQMKDHQEICCHKEIACQYCNNQIKIGLVKVIKINSIL